MHADMEERQQRQLHEYQAKVNEIRECCQRSGMSFAINTQTRATSSPDSGASGQGACFVERLEEMLGHIFQSVNMVYNAVWTGAAAT